MKESDSPKFIFDHAFLYVDSPERYLELGAVGFDVDPKYTATHEDSATSKALRFRDNYLEYVELVNAPSKLCQPGFSFRADSPISELLLWCNEIGLKKYGPRASQSKIVVAGESKILRFLTFEKSLVTGVEFWITEYETNRTWNVDHPNSTENFTGAVWDLPTDHPLRLFFDNCEGFELNPEHLESLPKGKVPPSGLSSLILSAKDRDKASSFFGEPVLDNQEHTVFSHSLPGKEFDLLIDVNRFTK